MVKDHLEKGKLPAGQIKDLSGRRDRSRSPVADIRAKGFLSVLHIGPTPTTRQMPKACWAPLNG